MRRSVSRRHLTRCICENKYITDKKYEKKNLELSNTYLLITLVGKRLIYPLMNCTAIGKVIRANKHLALSRRRAIQTSRAPDECCHKQVNILIDTAASVSLSCNVRLNHNFCTLLFVPHKIVARPRHVCFDGQEAVSGLLTHAKLTETCVND